MNCFQLVRSVLDDLYQQISSLYNVRTDEMIHTEILRLSQQYQDLHEERPHSIDYSNPLTRFAYLFSYTTAHADIMYQLLCRTESLQQLFQQPMVNLSCIGGGPGSDLLGVLKYITLQHPSLARLRCLICDREHAWRETWYEVDTKIQLSIPLSTTFWELDVTDSTAYTSVSSLFRANLFTMIYFLSELYYYREDAFDFFDTMVQAAQPGAYFLVVENNADCFYSWFDTMAANAGLHLVSKREDYRFTTGWDEQTHDLSTYITKLERTPKIIAHIAYRLYQK